MELKRELSTSFGESTKKINIGFDTKRSEYRGGLVPSKTLTPSLVLVPSAGVLVAGGENIAIRFLEEGEYLHETV